MSYRLFVTLDNVQSVVLIKHGKPIFQPLPGLPKEAQLFDDDPK